MMDDFQRLHEYFNDDGYDSFSTDMSSAKNAAKDVIDQMAAVARAINDYAESLKDAV